MGATREEEQGRHEWYVQLEGRKEGPEHAALPFAGLHDVTWDRSLFWKDSFPGQLSTLYVCMLSMYVRE